MKTNFSSLDPLLKIIKNEATFKIQVITTEPFTIFTQLLKSKEIKFMVTASSIKKYSSNEIYLILRDSKIELPPIGKYILFSNLRDTQFVQLVFKPTESERLEYLKSFGTDAKKIYDLYGKSKNLKDMVLLLKKEENVIPLPVVTNYEAILISCCREMDFDKIVGLAVNLDVAFSNKFFVLMTLNGLVERGLLKKKNNCFIVAIRDDILKKIFLNLKISTFCL